MVNEGAKIMAEGIAYRPVDIDIIYLNGYGFPAARGGRKGLLAQGVAVWKAPASGGRQ